MRKFVLMALLGMTALVLAGCGGDSGSCNKLNAGGTTGGTTTASGCGTVSTVTPTAITVASGAATIPGDGSATVTITAEAKDANNTGLAGVPITFSTSAGSVTVVTGTTDANGNATATLSASGVTAGTVITVTATSGTVSGNTAVTVSDTQQSITLQTNSPQIPSDGSKPATITALVRDSSNNFVPGVVVHFTSTSGGITVNASGSSPAGTTDSNGSATASLATAGDPTNRTITVTATVGATSKTISVDVVGTTLTLSGPDSLVQGDTGTFNVSLADSSKTAIPSATVTVASSAGNTLSAATLTTDSSGHGTFQLTATKSGTDTVSIAGLGLAATHAVSVSSQLFTFTAPAAGANINLGQSVPVTVNWTSNGQPVVGQVVTFASTRGTVGATATTDSAGNASVTVSATSSGPGLLSASASGVSATQDVTFVATTPNSIALQASPSTVTIKGQSTITAIVRDAQNNLVQGKSVAFTVNDVTGGSLSVATATTDAEGVAQTVYTASSTPSTSNGVVVMATVQGTSISTSTNLTVGGQTVFISLGTGATIAENASKTQFQMPWVVQAVDAGGNPVGNVSITLTIHSASKPYFAYFKGIQEVCGSSWVPYDGSQPPVCSPAIPPPQACYNEDASLTGVFDPTEDLNGNHKFDPGDVAVATPGILTTAADGSGTFLVEYPEDHARWVQTTLTATATVAGTQSSTTATFVLPLATVYATNTSADPPGKISPYGVVQDCTNAN